MAKLTLLEIVQDIANDLETDSITSIADTVESIQIAQIVKTTYFEMMANRNWPHLKTTLQLTDPASSSVPTHMLVPLVVKEVKSVAYNKRKSTDTKDKYDFVLWMEPEDFLYKINQRDSSASNIDTVTDTGGIDLFIRNDKAPEYYTSFDDEYIVMDSYDSAVDTNYLLGSKTQVIGYSSPTWTHSDSFTPDLPEEAFPALVEEAKSTAFVVLKQQANEKAEQKAGRQHRWLARKAWKTHGGVKYSNYGRKKHSLDTRKDPKFNPDMTV